MTDKKPTIHELRAFILEVAEWSGNEIRYSELSLHRNLQFERVNYFCTRGFELLGDISIADANRIREKGKRQS